MPPDEDGGFLRQLVSRGVEPFSTGCIAASCLADKAFVCQLAGWGLKEIIDACLRQLPTGEKNEDAYAKLQEQLRLHDVKHIANHLDVRTDAPKGEDLAHMRDAYEELSDALVEAYLALAHVHQRREQERKNDTSIPPLAELANPDDLLAKLQHIIQARSALLSRTDEAIRACSLQLASLQLDLNTTLAPPKLAELKRRPGASTSGSPDRSDHTYKPAEIYVQPQGLAHEVRTAMASACTIGFVGMGGIGKTALACEVFKTAKMKDVLPDTDAPGEVFDKKVWLHVGRKPNFRELLGSAFRQLFDPDDTYHLPFEMAERGLQDLALRVKQENLRVLLVLDDVWLSRKHSVVAALNFVTRPEVYVPGSRLIVTTRQWGTLSYDGKTLMNADALRIVQVPPLSRESAWQLFEHHTMASYWNTYTDEYEDTGEPRPFSDNLHRRIESLIGELDGNAQAMVDLGERVGYYRKPASDGNEESCETDLIGCLKSYEGNLRLTDACSEPSDEMLKSCAKSVDEAALSPSLRDCFAAFAAFPQDQRVPESVLLHLFSARCPLHAPGAVDEARRKLAHLVSSSLVSEHEPADGRQPTYSMHRILHRIAVWKAAQQREHRGKRVCHFDFTPYPNTSLSDEARRGIRYLSAHKRTTLDAIFGADNTPPELRALIISDVENSLAQPVWPLRLRFMHLCGALRVVPPTPHHAVPRANLMLLNFLCLAGSTHTDAIIKAILPVPYLEHLDLSGCNELKAVPDTIGECAQLTHLNLSGCSSLTKLHQSPKVSLPASLAHLNLSGCTALSQLPQLAQLGNGLTHIDLSECQVPQLDSEIAEKIFNHCKRLMSLRLPLCTQLTKLSSLERVHATLQHLDLRGCTALQKLQPTIALCSQLAHLNLDRCCSLEVLPGSISKCIHLSHLDLSSCNKLKAVPDAICECAQLTHLNLSGCISLTMLHQSPEVSLPSSLAHLNLSGCTALMQLPQLAQPVNSLTHIDLSECQVPQLEFEIPENIFNCCTRLVSLRLACCEHLTDFPCLEQVSATLQQLDLRGCAALQYLPSTIGSCAELAQLDLNGCSRLNKLPSSITKCRSLSHLDIGDCVSLEGLPDGIRGCCEQMQIIISGCPGLSPNDLQPCVQMCVSSCSQSDADGCSAETRCPRNGCSVSPAEGDSATSQT